MRITMNASRTHNLRDYLCFATEDRQRVHKSLLYFTPTGVLAQICLTIKAVFGTVCLEY